MNLITVDFLARMRRLNWPVRRTLPGFSHGPHRGQTRGAGLEFSEYRRYEPGDDLRRIDWKLAARSDRYFVREAERDSQVPIWLLLDSSASMQAPVRDGRYHKAEFGAAILAAVAMMAARQGDAVGLGLLSDTVPLVLPARRGQREVQRLVAELSRVRADGKLPAPRDTKAFSVALRSRSVVLLVSDFLDDISLGWLRWLQVAGHDVVAIALSSAEERAFPDSANRLIGYEGEPPLSVSAAARGGYLDARAEHFRKWSRWCLQHQVQWLEAAIEDSPETVVRNVLQHRAAGGATWS